MNTSLKTVVGLALVVVLSAGLAMAGRGGGGAAAMAAVGAAVAAAVAAVQRRRRWRAMEAAVAGVPHAFFQHPASELQRVASEFQHAGVSAVVAAEFRGQPSALRRAVGASGLELPTRPIGTTALTPGIVRASTIVRILGTGQRRQTVRTSATTSTSTTGRTTSSGQRITIGTAATGTTGIGTATGTTLGIIGRWAGGRPATGPVPPFPRFHGPGDIGRTTTRTTRVRSSSAVQPSITRNRSWWLRRPPRRPSPKRV